jgi:hypothetical protein
MTILLRAFHYPYKSIFTALMSKKMLKVPNSVCYDESMSQPT